MYISVWLVSVVLLLTPSPRTVQASQLEIVYEWKYLDWIPPSVQLVGNNFTLGNAFTQDVDVDKCGRVFVTSPKWPEGVPIVLSTVTDLHGPGGPLLAPYPNWTWHRPNDCNNIVTAYRIAVNMRVERPLAGQLVHSSTVQKRFITFAGRLCQE